MDRKEFDFYLYVYGILRQRYGPSLIPYHELYSYMGKRFCFRRADARDLLKSMEAKGYLTIKKRGILLSIYKWGT